MSYKTFIVYLSNREDAERLIPLATTVARQFDAHLIGVHSVQRIDLPTSLSMQISGAMSELHTIQEKDASEVKGVFEKLTSASGISCEWLQVETIGAETGERMAELTRCADVVIMAQVDPEQSHPGPATIQRQVIEHSGRPVLIIPRYGEFEHIGSQVLIGWSGTSQCTRAVHDAIPFCQQGGETTIFWINSDDKITNSKLEKSGNDLAVAMGRHGINATIKHFPKTKISIADEILNAAADNGADLIVTGAYGHSRLYDLVIGATTSHLLANMTVPVLFAR